MTKLQNLLKCPLNVFQIHVNNVFRSTLKLVGSVSVGIIICWLVINMSAGPGTIVTSMEEAEGPQFSDPGTLDIVTSFHRNRVCPAVTQRYKWRWITYNGERMQQVLPIMATYAPFLADGNKVMLTLRNPEPQDVGDEWFYRTVTVEQCGFMPSWASMAFGTRIYRSPDKPVNFVGAPHHD